MKNKVGYFTIGNKKVNFEYCFRSGKMQFTEQQSKSLLIAVPRVIEMLEIDIRNLKKTIREKQMAIRHMKKINK